MKDRYCLKQGRLELSMLEENIDEIEALELLQEKMTYIPIEKDDFLEEGDEFKTSFQPQIKVSEEIYNTLKSMGELLTHEVCEITPEEQEMLLCEDESKLKDMIVEQEDAIKNRLEDRVVEQEDVIKNKLEGHKKLENEEGYKAMSQNSIDDIIFSHFGETVPKFKYAEELKKKIDRRINWIKSYPKKSKE